MKGKIDIHFSRKKSGLPNFGEIILILILISTICNSCFSSIQNNSSQRSVLNFKAVLEGGTLKNLGYEPGKELYPSYSYEGLPDDFLIKKSPDLSLTDRDIKLIEIERNQFSPSYMAVYTVTIHLQQESAERMRTFSAKYLNKRVGLEIDGKIFKITTLIDVMSSQVVVHIARTSFSEIESQFRKITDKIRIKGKN